MRYNYDNSPLNKSNRPLPHQIQQFLIDVGNMIQGVKFNENELTDYYVVIRWLEKLAK